MRRLVLNATLGPAARARRDPEQALAAWHAKAEATAAAADIGPDAADREFIADLGFLLQCFARVPGLTPVGWTAQLREAEQRLENRLRVKWIHSQNPLVGDERIERPVFILGLPRTAGGLVQRILANSEPHRGPLVWELLRTGLDRDGSQCERSRETVARQLEALTALTRSGDAINPQRADWPGDSAAVMWRTYRPLRCAPMPDYRARLEQTDVTADYEYLRQILQVLQYGREPRRWILRFPGHVAHLDLIRQVFPDAAFVWVHRDPAAAVASFCSLVEALEGMHHREVDPLRIGRNWLGALADTVQRGRKLRRALPESAVVDLNYHRLTFDPHRFAPELYERLGAQWTKQDSLALNAIAGPQARETKGRHGLERYGLNEIAVQEAFIDPEG